MHAFNNIALCSRFPINLFDHYDNNGRIFFSSTPNALCACRYFFLPLIVKHCASYFVCSLVHFIRNKCLLLLLFSLFSWFMFCICFSMYFTPIHTTRTFTATQMFTCPKCNLRWWIEFRVASVWQFWWVFFGNLDHANDSHRMIENTVIYRSLSFCSKKHHDFVCIKLTWTRLDSIQNQFSGCLHFH